MIPQQKRPEHTFAATGPHILEMSEDQSVYVGDESAGIKPLAKEWRHLRYVFENYPGDDIPADFTDNVFEVAARIVDTPATLLADLRIRAEVALFHIDEPPEGSSDRAIYRLCRDVLRFIRRGPLISEGGITFPDGAGDEWLAAFAEWGRRYRAPGRGATATSPPSRPLAEMEREACRLWNENDEALGREEDDRAIALRHKACALDAKILTQPCASPAEAAVQLRRILDAGTGRPQDTRTDEEVPALAGILRMLERMAGAPDYPTRPVTGDADPSEECAA